MKRLLFLLLCLFAAPAAAENRAALAPGVHETVVNGVRLWYRVAGRTKGVPVVYLHGGPGQGSQSFAKFAGPELEKGLRMVYLDQRGSGRSERPWNDAYSLDLLVDDLEKLRIAWGVPKLALVGQSFGTAIGMEYAARYPDRVSHLVLAAGVPDIPAALDLQCARLERVDPEAFARAKAALREGDKARCNVFAAYEGAAARAFIDRNMYPKPETMKLVDEADSEGGLSNAGELGNAIVRQGFFRYRFDKAERLTMPVLVIAGGKDFQAVAEPQRALAERVRNGRYLEYAESGHFMFVEEPERFGRDVTAFIAGR
ncbi:MAG TPA: alpha/beta hydrolase [Allosphingosinicella sp.]|jgi:proline iminopeptidase|nr:alpha/beta hydrolase [Allosphingosinicella sp.]